MTSASRPRTPPRVLDIQPTAEEVAAAAAATVHEGFILVQRVAYGREAETLDKVHVPLFATEVARIRVNAGVTRNLGDFNSARVDVMVELPCYPERSEIMRAYQEIEGLLDELVVREMEKAGIPS